jgi:hypothetical protein
MKQAPRYCAAEAAGAAEAAFGPDAALAAFA